MTKWEYDITSYSIEQVLAMRDKLGLPPEPERPVMFCTDKGACFFDNIPDANIQIIIDILNSRDLDGWQLRRLVWVADRGFASATNRGYLTRGGGHYIHAEKLRHTNTEAAAALARPGRYHTVADNLRVKEVHVAPGGNGDGDGGARAVRFVVCHNPDQAQRDAQVRDNLVHHLRELITDSDTWTPRRRDEFVGSLKTKPGLRRYLRRTKTGLLRVDAAAMSWIYFFFSFLLVMLIFAIMKRRIYQTGGRGG